MRNVLRYTFSLALGLMASTAMAEPVKFARYPHASQGKLVFSYHGDIWIANENGSNPVRLTAHIARDTFPRLSPDGKLVAFTSDRFGNADVFVVPATGGEPKQLTFNTVPDTVLNWTPDGQGILVTTSRAVSPWRSPIHVVPVNGGLPTPLPIDGGVQGMIKQDGSTLAFNRMGGSYWRKGYRGNRSDDVWIQDLKTQQHHAAHRHEREGLQELHAGRLPDVGRRRADLLLVRAERSFQHLAHRPTGGQPQQVTTHTDDGVQFPVDEPGRLDDRVRKRLRDLDAEGRQPDAHARHDRSRVRSQHQPDQFRCRRRTGWTASRSPRTATTRPSTSTARSSSFRPIPTSARSVR